MRAFIATLGIATFLVLSGTVQAESKSDQQQDILNTSQDILSTLYSFNPGAREVIRRAAGYATFSNIGMKIFFAGGGSGKGVVVDNRTKQQVFMKMVEIQAGLGFGVDKFKLVWVFENRADLYQFINNGWELGASANVSAQGGGQGGGLFSGAMAVQPGVWLYQLTDTGLAVELTAKGTKYYQDSSLN